MNPCDWPVISWTCDAAEDAVGSAFEDGSIKVLSAIARGVTSFAAMVLDGLWKLIQRLTNPQTDADFLYQWSGMLFGIALPITVAFMVFQVIQAVLRARGFTRSGVFSAVTGAALAIFGTAASLPIVHYLTLTVDGIAEAMSGVIVGDIDTLGESFAEAVGGPGVSLNQLFASFGQTQVVGEGVAGVLGGLIGMIILGFLMIMGGIAVFAALLIRSLLLYAVVVTGPIAFLGLVWSPVRPWFRRWVTAVVALIFTKLGVVVVFGLGISAMNNLDFDGGVLEALGRLLSGTVLMLISAFVPIVSFKFFGFLGEQAVESLHAETQSGIHRGREAAAQFSPQQVLQRISRYSSNGSFSRSASQRTTAQQRQATATTGTSTGVQGGGGATTAGAGAAGTAAAGVGAVVGASKAAAEKTRSVGRRAGERVETDNPYRSDPRPPKRPPPRSSGPRQS